MSLNFNDFDDWIYDWVVQYTSLDVVWANTNGVKPDLPYIVMDKNPLIPIGQNQKTTPDSNGYILIIQANDLTINFQAIGSNSYGELNNLSILTSDPNSQQILITNGISLIDPTPITNLTGLVDENYEERASMDLRFRFSIIYGENDTIETGIIKKVNIDAEYEAPTGTKTSTINIDGTI